MKLTLSFGSNIISIKKILLIYVILCLGALSSQVNANENSSKYGGYLILATTSDPKSFNDIVAKETTSTAITSKIFEGLTTLNAVNSKVEPHLAYKWDVSDDGLEWIFYLRENVQWFDGEPFTADDVVFTYNDLIYNPEIANSAKEIFTIDGKIFEVTKISDYKVKFVIPTKNATFLRGLSQSILPQHALQQSVKDKKFNFTWGIDTLPKDIIGTGPFLLSSYQPGERIVLKRNPHYWKKSKEGDALPYLDGIKYMIVQNSDVSFLKFMDGELDYIGVKGTDYPLLKPFEQRDNFEILDLGPAFGTSFICFNQNTSINEKTNTHYVNPVKSKWFTDLQFRKAVAHAIDKDKIIEIVKNGFAYRQEGPMSPSAGFFYNPDVVKYEYNLDKARQILKDAGYMDRNNDKIIEDAQGNDIVFNLFTGASGDERIQISEIISYDLKQLGMKVNFTPIEFNVLVGKLTSTFDWDAIVLGLTGGNEPHFGNNVWQSSGGLHLWYPKQKKPATEWERRIDEIFKLGVQELDPEKRKVLYFEHQRIVAERLPVIYTILDSQLTAVRKKFGNLKPTGLGGVFHNLEEIYIKSEYR